MNTVVAEPVTPQIVATMRAMMQQRFAEAALAEMRGDVERAMNLELCAQRLYDEIQAAEEELTQAAA